MGPTNKICPLCGNKKKQSSNLICPDCYRIFVTEAGKSLAIEGKIINVAEWTKQRAKSRLAELKLQLGEFSQKYTTLQDEVSNAAFSAVRQATNGKMIAVEVFNAAVKEKGKVIWKEKGGNRLYYELKTTETQIAFLEGFINNLQRPERATPQEMQKLEEPAKGVSNPQQEKNEEEDTFGPTSENN